MNVNIDIKNAASSILQFVKGHGGNSQRSEVLELLAKVCGFDCYRALKAAEDSKDSMQITPVQGQIRQSTFMPVKGRTLEDPARVVFRAPTMDWELAEQSEEDRQDFPAERRTRYDFLVEEFGHQFRVLLKPEGVGLDNFEGQPVLDMLIEINDGVPCVHMTNDPADAMLLTVFASGEGIVARPDDGHWGTATRDLPPVLTGLVTRNCDARERYKSQVCVLDTHAKYADDKVAGTPPVISSTAKLEAPKDPRFAGTAVTAGLQAMFSDQYLMMTVALVDEQGEDTDLGQEDCPFPGPSSFVTVIPLATGMASLQLHVECAAKVAAYLMAGGIGVAETATLIRKLATCSPNDPLAPMFMAMKEVRTGSDAVSVYRRLANYVCVID